MTYPQAHETVNREEGAGKPTYANVASTASTNDTAPNAAPSTSPSSTLVSSSVVKELRELKEQVGQLIEIVAQKDRIIEDLLARLGERGPPTSHTGNVLSVEFTNLARLVQGMVAEIGEIRSQLKTDQATLPKMGMHPTTPGTATSKSPTGDGGKRKRRKRSPVGKGDESTTNSSSCSELALSSPTTESSEMIDKWMANEADHNTTVIRIPSSGENSPCPTPAKNVTTQKPKTSKRNSENPTLNVTSRPQRTPIQNKVPAEVKDLYSVGHSRKKKLSPIN